MEPYKIGVAVCAAVFAIGGTAASALTITPLAESVAAAEIEAALGSIPGVSITSTSYIGADSQAGTYTGLSLMSSDPGEPTLTLGDGFLLTTGSAILPTSNTSDAFAEFTDTGANAEIEAALAAAGTPAEDGTFDQNVFSFEFTAAPGITALTFDFLFGSDEFSEFPTFIDSFMFFVDGVNYAFFPNGDLISQSGGTAGFFNDNENDSYGIEYDGLTDVFSLTGLLDLGLTTHTATFAIADANDQDVDSGVFVSGLGGSTIDTGGINPDPIDDPIDDPTTPNPVPLPAAGWMMLAGLLSIRALRKR